MALASTDGANDMGRSRTIRYTVSMKIAKGMMTPAEYQPKYCGKPGAAGLAKFVTDYNASLAADGVNAHIGAGGRAYSATLTDHTKGVTVATWAAPMFEVVS